MTDRDTAKDIDTAKQSPLVNTTAVILNDSGDYGDQSAYDSKPTTAISDSLTCKRAADSSVNDTDIPRKIARGPNTYWDPAWDEIEVLESIEYDPLEELSASKKQGDNRSKDEKDAQSTFESSSEEKIIKDSDAKKKDDVSLLTAHASEKIVTKKTLRTFKSLPVFIVENHDDVLEFIYRCVGSRHLPVLGNMLIHFDSHPDMVISREMSAEQFYDKDQVRECTGIESWIMPLCYTGVVTRLVWIKNSWCQQMSSGKFSFYIGMHKDMIFVDLPFPYFLSESCYCDTEMLTNKRKIELFIIDAADLDAYISERGVKQMPEHMNFLKSYEIGKSFPYLLDVDLDFFSTQNPFLQMYPKVNCYEKIGEIFAFEAEANEQRTPLDINSRREVQLHSLKNVFNYLEENGTLSEYVPTDTAMSLDQKTLKRIECLLEQLNSHYMSEKIEWLTLYDAGCTTDTGGLPHHTATDEELKISYERFSRFLDWLPQRPIAVTIARSTEDEYCPQSQVEEIQSKVLETLQSTTNFKDACHPSHIRAYLGESYDIMSL